MTQMPTGNPNWNQEKPEKGWFGRNWWWVLLLILLFFGCIASCCGGGIWFSLWSFGKMQESYDNAAVIIEADPRVQAVVGKPVSVPEMAIVQSQNNIQTTAPFVYDFTVSGPNGTLDVSLVMNQGNDLSNLFIIEEVTIYPPDGEPVTIIIDGVATPVIEAESSDTGASP